MLNVGDVIGDKLRIERILGQGGMGVVAVATHLQLEQRVAIKVLHDRLATEPDVVARFLREARAVAKLKCEQVCRVWDVGQDAGAPYMVMELLEGRDLAHVLEQRPLALSTAVDYLLQACIALAEAHARGIVHRDLKPANLFVTKRLDGSPLIKVLDFGIAKAPTGVNTSLTQTDTVMGTPGYMSPEQLRSTRDVDMRSDIWSLGVILYQAVSGRLPFPAASLTEVAVKIAMDPPDPIDVDARFRDVVMRCLEKDRERRYRDVAALAHALAPFGSAAAATHAALVGKLLEVSGGIADTLVAGEPAASTGAAATVATTLRGAAAESRPIGQQRARTARPAWIIAAVAAGVAIVGGGAFVVTRGEPAAPVAPAEAAAPSPTPTPIPTPSPTPTPIPTPTPTPTTALPAPAPQHASAETTTAKTSASLQKMLPDAARQAARDAAMDGDWPRELKYLEIVLRARPTDASSLLAAALAECSLDRVAEARAYALRLPAKEQRTAAMFCSNDNVTLDLPDFPDQHAATAPLAVGAPTPDAAQQRRDFEAAITKHRCTEAQDLATKLGDASLDKRAQTCDDTRKQMIANPLDPDGEAWVLAWVDEQRAIPGSNPNLASSLRENFYYGRATLACKAHDAGTARDAYAKMTIQQAKDRARSNCAGLDVTLP